MQLPDLAPHQAKAVAELDNGKILCGGVGAGKSRAAMRYYINKEAPRNVYIITTAKKRDSFDWQTEAFAHGVGSEADATFAGVFTVDSWNNIEKYVGVKDAFFIFDEQRLVGAGSWVKSFYKITKANHWILLSATPGDTWLDYIPVFVANGLYKNRTEFLREHVVYNTYSKFPKVDRYIGVGRLVRHRNHLLVDMPFERHTERIVTEVVVEHDEAKFRRVVKDRWHIFENRPLRDVAELFTVMRKVVNTDASRLEAVRFLITQHPRLIVFYNFDYELEILRKLSEKCPDTISKSKNSKSSCQSGPPKNNGRSSKTSSNSEETSPSVSRAKNQSGIEAMRIFDSQDTSSFAVSQDVMDSSATAHIGSEEWTVKSRDVTGNFQTVDLEKNPIQRSVIGSEEKTSKSSSKKHTIQIAEWNGHKHQPIPDSERWVYLVQYTAGAEGWNCTTTDTCVFFSLNYSYRIMEQCMGRIDRMNTPYFTLHYYVLKSKSMIDTAIWSALKKKKNFQQPTKNTGIWATEKVFF